MLITTAGMNSRPVPRAVQDAPTLPLWLSLYWTAFQDLTSCRLIGINEGPIPYLAMIEWCKFHALDELQIEELLHHLPRMDAAYLKFHAAKNEQSP